MNEAAVIASARIRIESARALQLCGWSGIAGLALILVSVCLIVPAWMAQRAFLAERLNRVGGTGPAAVIGTTTNRTESTQMNGPAITPELPRVSDIPLLLTQMEQAAVGNGLAWRAADYKIVAATPARPASLETRCSIKGPYPKLRGMLVQLMRDVPTFTLHEFNLTRPSSDAGDVEAKLVMAVFLQDEASLPDLVLPKATR